MRKSSLTGAYFTGNPLDSMRGIIDQPRYVQIGTLPDLEPEEIRNQRDMAGMIRCRGDQGDEVDGAEVCGDYGGGFHGGDRGARLGRLLHEGRRRGGSAASGQLCAIPRAHLGG